MSNSYFKFKEFTIEQDHCAMKVSTDACIHGAWTPILPDVQTVLDIGTGTGLLSLMLAQRSNAIYIDAIELDGKTAQQAAENITAAPWSERIAVTIADVRTFTPAHQYDLIICNPPFFQNSLLGDEDARNIARHTLSLSYQDLFSACERLLKIDGYASVMLPYAEHKIWQGLLRQNGWCVFNKLVVKHRENGTPTRIIGLCRRGVAVTEEEMLVIKDNDEQYTAAFTALLQPYYLNL